MLWPCTSLAGRRSGGSRLCGPVSSPEWLLPAGASGQPLLPPKSCSIQNGEQSKAEREGSLSLVAAVVSVGSVLGSTSGVCEPGCPDLRRVGAWGTVVLVAQAACSAPSCFSTEDTELSPHPSPPTAPPYPRLAHWQEGSRGLGSCWVRHLSAVTECAGLSLPTVKWASYSLFPGPRGPELLSQGGPVALPGW